MGKKKKEREREANEFSFYTLQKIQLFQVIFKKHNSVIKFSLEADLCTEIPKLGEIQKRYPLSQLLFLQLYYMIQNVLHNVSPTGVILVKWLDIKYT